MTLPNDAPCVELDDDGPECPACGGAGFLGHDCGEDSCCCLHPEPNVRCDVCGGTGDRPVREEPTRG